MTRPLGVQVDVVDPHAPQAAALDAATLDDASSAAAGPSGQVLALLEEVASLLDGLSQSGEGGSIDLASLPLAPGEREQLRANLGEGEVIARIQALGESVARETAYPGVWWVTHDDPNGARAAELIEIARVPEIVAADSVATAEGAARLREDLKRGSDSHGIDPA